MLLEPGWPGDFYYSDYHSRTMAMRQESLNYPESDYMALQIVSLGIYVKVV